MLTTIHSLQNGIVPRVNTSSVQFVNNPSHINTDFALNHIVSKIPGFANSDILTSVWLKGMYFVGYIAASLSEQLTALRTTILLNVGNSSTI